MNRSKIIYIYLVAVFILLPLSGCDEDETPVAPVVDHIAPAVEWISPASGAELSGVIELAFNVYDEGGIDSACVYINGSLFGEGGHSCPPPKGEGRHSCLPVNSGQTASADTIFTLSWNTTDVEDGLYILEARAWDASGNMGTSPALLVRVKNNEEPPPEDTSPPVISWLSPQPGDTLEGTAELHFQVLDDVGVDSVKVYLNGREWQKLIDDGQYLDCHVNWITSEVPDGNYIIQIKAWDCSQNVGMSVVICFNVWNNRPRVIWVPDDYEKIQDAINASEDGDTVRVRAGIYNEGIRLMGKQIWLESEEGPEETTLNFNGWNNGISIVEMERLPTTIRGFRIYGGWQGILTDRQVVVNIYNCLLDSIESIGININASNSKVFNCLFTRCETGFRFGYTWGEIYNCIFTECEVAMIDFAALEAGLKYGWNLFWENDIDHSNFEPSQSDLFVNPEFIQGTYRLSNSSPARDAGNPDILDRDGSRSDIGLYGGPYSY